jgi:hypothetical protein
MRLRSIFTLFFIFLSIMLVAQMGTLTGTVTDKNTQETLIGAVVSIVGTSFATETEIDGAFKIEGIPAKTYTISVSYTGYKTDERYNVIITSGNVNVINFLMSDDNVLSEVVISESKSIGIASVETPLSIQNLGVEEIKNNPGGNFDISKVLGTLPGVGGTPGGGSFRNDLLIRGGGPSENVYYLDGVEIPVLNHFTTQGAAGGPTGMLNVSFIEDATLISSAFPAKYDNPLSSVLQFRQREGNKERFQGNFRVSASETALTTEGPIGSKTTFLASARRSYLQFLFELIGLPIRPNYWDFQYKVTHKFDSKTTLTAIGLGAIDDFYFEAPKEETPENLYVLSSAPSIQQWNYTQGFTLKRLTDDGYWNLTFSRNMFDNDLKQFADNYDGKQSDPAKLNLGVGSQEIENKLRFDHYLSLGNDWNLQYGAGAQYVKYNNNTIARILPEIKDTSGTIIQPGKTAAFATDINFVKYGVFAQVSRKFLNDKLGFSGGLRMDGNSFTDTGNNIWETFSPRMSLSYALLRNFKVNTSVGRYYKIAPYTALGFQDQSGFANKSLPYLRTDHATAGVEYLPTKTLRLTLEGFYKKYTDYPVSALSGISLANQGADFGIVGNEKLLATGEGEAYGMEVFAQQKLVKNTFVVASYTLFWTKFSGADGKLTPSAWDNRHLVSLTLGQKLGRNWELGLKFRLQGGTPYTPIDLEASQLNFAVLGKEVLDYSRLNSLRLGNFSQLDLRVDKKWNFKRFTLDLFLDVQNAIGTANPVVPVFTLKRNADNTGFETKDGKPLAPDSANGIPIILDTSDGAALPSIGLIVEF